MKNNTPARPRPGIGTNGRATHSTSGRPLIEFDEKAGALRINDARLITRNLRAFCRRLAVAIIRRPEVTKATIDLASASCRVEFASGSGNLRAMADVFAGSVRKVSRRVNRRRRHFLVAAAHQLGHADRLRFRGPSFALGDARG